MKHYIISKNTADEALGEKDATIAELKDKCQMHDFFWESCGFAKREFKNTIAVSEAFDRIEAENRKLKRSLELASNECCSISERAVKHERKLRRALYKACANWARYEGILFADEHEAEKWSKMIRKCLKKAKEYK